MDLDRIYRYRFRNIDQAKRQKVWQELGTFLYNILGHPEAVLDPAAGMCEFINSINCKEKWAVDLNASFLTAHAQPEVIKVVGDTRNVELPLDHFDAIFVSNFLEHLHSQEEVADLLHKLYGHLRPGGKIAIMGPNFKYAYSEYFDFADHTVILSELGIAEHLYGAGFSIQKIYPRFLPLSFRGRLPVHRHLVRLYLRTPWVWPFFGKQFLIVGRK